MKPTLVVPSSLHTLGIEGDGTVIRAAYPWKYTLSREENLRLKAKWFEQTLQKIDAMKKRALELQAMRAAAKSRGHPMPTGSPYDVLNDPRWRVPPRRPQLVYGRDASDLPWPQRLLPDRKLRSFRDDQGVEWE